jgi:hypothetical protein
MEPNALGHGSLQRFRKICASRLPQVSTHALPDPPSASPRFGHRTTRRPHPLYRRSRPTYRFVLVGASSVIVATVTNKGKSKVHYFHFLLVSISSVAGICTTHTFDRQRSTAVSPALVAVVKVYGESLDLFLSSNGIGCDRVPCAQCHGGMPLASGCGPDSDAARDGAPLRPLTPANVPEPGATSHTLTVRLRKLSKRPSRNCVEGRLDKPVTERLVRMSPLSFPEEYPFY